MAKHTTSLTLLTNPPQALYPANAALTSTTAFLAASETLQRLNMGSLSRIEATVSLPAGTSSSTLSPSPSNTRRTSSGGQSGKRPEGEGGTENGKTVETLLVIQSAVRDAEEIPLLVTSAGDADRRAELKLRVRRMEEAGKKWGRMIEQQ